MSEKQNREAGELLQYGYPNSVIAARTGLSEREVEDIRQIKQIFRPVYKEVKKERKRQNGNERNVRRGLSKVV